METLFVIANMEATTVMEIELEFSILKYKSFWRKVFNYFKSNWSTQKRRIMRLNYNRMQRIRNRQTHTHTYIPFQLLINQSKQYKPKHWLAPFSLSLSQSLNFYLTLSFHLPHARNYFNWSYQTLCNFDDKMVGFTESKKSDLISI